VVEGRRRRAGPRPAAAALLVRHRRVLAPLRRCGGVEGGVGNQRRKGRGPTVAGWMRGSWLDSGAARHGGVDSAPPARACLRKREMCLRFGGQEDFQRTLNELARLQGDTRTGWQDRVDGAARRVADCAGRPGLRLSWAWRTVYWPSEPPQRRRVHHGYAEASVRRNRACTARGRRGSESPARALFAFRSI
jgi:hypothetical protein